MQEKHVLVVSSNRAIQRHITRSLVSAGLKVETCPAEKEPITKALAEGPPMCILDLESNRELIYWFLDEQADKQPETVPLLVSNGEDMPFLHDLLANRNLNNLIPRQGGVAASGEIIDELELIVTCQKLFRRDIFGLEKYLPAWGIQIYDHEIGSTRDKQGAMGELRQFLTQLDCSPVVLSTVTLVADELLMNAIFDAPRDDEGRPKYFERSRDERIELEPRERIRFRYTCDGRNIALSVADQFGCLDREVILKYIERCFSGETKEIEPDRMAGAGLGLYMVFNSISQLTFNIHVGVSTEVIAMFYVRSGAKAFRSAGRSLNIFVVK